MAPAGQHVLGVQLSHSRIALTASASACDTLRDLAAAIETVLLARAEARDE